MKNKGFVLSETLVVTIFVMIIFTLLYTSTVPLLGRYKELSYYDDLDTTYDLYSIKKMIVNDANFSTIKSNNYTKLECFNNTIADSNKCNKLFQSLNIDSLDEVIFIKKDQKQSVINDNDISLTVKEYLEYIDVDSDILVLQNDGYVSYIRIISAVELMISNASNKECNPIKRDNDTIYFSGNNDCIDFNYVWYSGRMWRIVSINETTKTIKMVTEETQTAISYNIENNTNFLNSYIFQWLNEDFYDTLYNPDNIIDNTIKWNATQTTEAGTKPDNTTLVSANVGLLNAYEYSKSFKNNASSNSYLNLGQNWWLLNSYNELKIWNVSYDSEIKNYSTIYGFAVRPSINLKSNVTFVGRGTISNPFTITIDKEPPKNNITNLNTRLVGEYVKLKNGINEQLFRIMGFENNTTKLIAMDYANNGNNLKFATDNLNGDGTIYSLGNTMGSLSDQTWYYYLNNIYLPNLKSIYGSNMFTSGSYYLGWKANTPSDTTESDNYKTSICLDDTIEKTSSCSKSSKIVLEVGLPRYGEIFACQSGFGYDLTTDTYSTKNMWLLTRYDNTHVYFVQNKGNTAGYALSVSYAARPTIYLKSDVKIFSGNGTPSSPYVVGL